VSLDTHLPNRLVLAALRAGALPRFAGYETVRPEARVGASRFDFLLEGPRGHCVLEVKSAGDVEDGEALFPDAPTSRGLRHLEELAVLAQGGTRAAVLFVAQGQACAVAMNAAIDPAFAQGLARAAAAGVEVCAYSCPLSRDGIALGEDVPVRMPALTPGAPPVEGVAGGVARAG
jgi:sugar fermentation stimulation protein A